MLERVNVCTAQDVVDLDSPPSESRTIGMSWASSASSSVER
ncbi:hypothetical protein RAJCM14343_5004 [Rhodococcus aetherivorans]|uniref:Uncharacterized protein n=1 Tax=Rhodococcus aetherivorans TaxID=191292 RepID=A0ABQ0YSX2_9NOCA|nr:hypothetical protein RAJCM14343_5004 [Rhodococcus aetherivorans]